MNNYYGDYNRVFDKLYFNWLLIVEIFSILFTFGVVKILLYCYLGTQKFYWIVSRWADEMDLKEKKFYVIQFQI